MASGPNSNRVSDAFPLYMRQELEIPVNRMGYAIGVGKHYPARLREMISAAAITYQLQNLSIDHVRRTYLKDQSYEEDPGGERRLDRPYRRACFDLYEAADIFLKTYPPLTGREPKLGEWIGDLTLIRVNYSFERAFAEADKGALYECVAIARMILEQICWAWSVRELDDVDAIERKNATKSVSELRKLHPICGRFYGWLSDHAHWAYSAHLKAITSVDQQSAAMLASSLFKAISYAVLILLSEIYLRIFSLFVKRERKRNLTASRQAWASASRNFKPARLLAGISKATKRAADVVSLQSILLNGPRYG